MESNKREKTMVTVTIALVIVLIISFIYDRNGAVLKRTLAYELPDDAKIVEMNKYGFSFYRVGYEAKILVNADNPEEILQCFVDGYDFSGSMMSGSEYADLQNLIFAEDGELSFAKIKPEPAPGSGVWMCEVVTQDDHTIVQLLDIEAGDNSYLYIYYIR